MMDERDILIRNIAQHLRDIGDKIDQNQTNTSVFQHLTIFVYSFMYYYNLYFNCK
jgi:hypothetical protein